MLLSLKPWLMLIEGPLRWEVIRRWLPEWSPDASTAVVRGPDARSVVELGCGG
tara:strand:+ start:409 stop:567 length:159 start_codon:yes stop_codon:yes gene_type:complete